MGDKASQVEAAQLPQALGQLKSLIVSGVKEAQSRPLTRRVLAVNATAKPGMYKNEGLLFIKPELTRPSNSIKFEPIVDLVLAKMAEFKLEILRVDVIGASQLKDGDIMASHYGVINAVARNAMGNLSDGARAKFKDSFGVAIENAKVLGGIEVLQKYPAFNPVSLDLLWQNAKSAKLAGGTYCSKFMFDGEEVHVLNGFHPRQLEQFIEAGRSIVAIHVGCNTPWKDLRGKLIGATDPTKAEAGSIRSELLKNKEKLGIPEVSQGYNGVHFSAGPIEGVVEMLRFFNDSDYSQKSLGHYGIGMQMMSGSIDAAKKVLGNPSVAKDGKNVSVFDLTEEQDTDAAIAMLKQANLL